MINIDRFSGIISVKFVPKHSMGPWRWTMGRWKLNIQNSLIKTAETYMVEIKDAPVKPFLAVLWDVTGACGFINGSVASDWKINTRTECQLGYLFGITCRDGITPWATQSNLIQLSPVRSFNQTYKNEICWLFYWFILKNDILWIRVYCKRS